MMTIEAAQQAAYAILTTYPWFESFRDFEIVSALSEPFLQRTGRPIAALLFFGATGLAFYVTQGRAVIPVILIVLIGGVTFADAPPVAGRFSIIIVMVFLTAMGWMLYQRARVGR